MSENLPSFIITGSEGWIGSSIISELLKKNFNVLALTKSKKKFQKKIIYHKNLSCIKFDLNNFTEETFSEIKLWSSLQNKISLIHCAGVAHESTETKEVIKKMHEVNSEGSKKVAKQFSILGLHRAVYISTISVYDWSKGDKLKNEQSDILLDTEYAKSKHQGEKHFLKYLPQTRVIRLSTVFGKGDTANIKKLSKYLHSPICILPDLQNTYKSYIPIDVAALLCIDVAVNSIWNNKIINAGLSHPVTLNEICLGLCNNLNIKRPIFISLDILIFLSKFGDLVKIFNKNFPFNSSNLNKIINSTAVDCSYACKNFPLLSKTKINDAIMMHKEEYTI